MKAIRRMTTGIMASFEALVGQIENHEAQVSSAIRDAEVSAARAATQLSRVTKDGAAMRRAAEEHRQKAQQWEERAKACAAADEAKALMCLKQRQLHLSLAAKVEEQSISHSALERQLSADLRDVHEKLMQLKRQRNIMRTRQSRAEAFLTINDTESRAIGEIDDLFDRWEARISACEIHSHSSVPSAEMDLDQEFRSAEEEQELKALLASLVASSTK